MINPYIYIDDSGSPGMEHIHPAYPASTKLYAAVIIKSSEKRKIEKKLYQELNNIKKRHTGVKEFHAKYIYAGTKEFEGLADNERLDIIERIVHCYNEFRFPVICKAVSQEAVNASGYSESVLNDRIDNFKLGKAEDFALMSLIGECDKYIQRYQNRYGQDSAVKVIADEGRQKPGTKQSVPYSADKIKEIEYADSEDEILLQFADFFAFIINRCQINFGKEQSGFDKAFMKIIGKINYNMHNDFIKMPYDNLEKMKKEDYLEYIKKLQKSKKSEEPLAKQLVVKTNRLYDEIESIKKYLDDSNMNYPKKNG